jgi:NAD(P)-dependent dehydrogenase (short-subunit alcohol dehydrogenase family)
MAVNDAFRLHGTRAVVTGGSSGIGAEICRALGRSGADVVAVHRNDPVGAASTSADLHAMGRRCVMLDGDTGDSGSIDELAGVAVRELGGIDIWVNNAAGLLVRPFLELTDADWHGLLAANLHGYFYGCRAAARQMARQGTGGRIVNVSSAADVQPLAEAVPYITAKGGIVAMTRSLALDLAPHAITVNAIAPGATDTAINATAYTPAVRAVYAERIALGHIAAPDEIADAAVFLATHAARYITGHELLVDGGLTINGSVGHGRDPS